MSSEAMHYSEKEGTLSVGIVFRCYNQPLTEPMAAQKNGRLKVISIY